MRDPEISDSSFDYANRLQRGVQTLPERLEGYRHDEQTRRMDTSISTYPVDRSKVNTQECEEFVTTISQPGASRPAHARPHLPDKYSIKDGSIPGFDARISSGPSG